MNGRCEFLEFLRTEIMAACADEPTPEAIAVRVEREIQIAWGGERVYVAAPANDRMQEGLRMLKNGIPPEKVATKLRVHVSTAHRWRAKIRKAPGSGLGRSDCVL